MVTSLAFFGRLSEPMATRPRLLPDRVRESQACLGWFARPHQTAKGFNIEALIGQHGDSSMQKPLMVLNQAINSQVIVELKGNREYRGVLDGYDPHMNIVLKNAEELVNNEVKRKLNVTIVRGDNVIYISP
jgi:small nuclear ribonucleoprotein